MAVREIFKMGNPKLYEVSAPVPDPGAASIAELLADMKDTLEHVRGNGLAAPQIGVPLRVVLYRLPANCIPAGANAKPIPWTAMINPVIEPEGTAKSLIWERCLSLPGLYARVPRYERVRISYLRQDGTRVEERWAGYVAMLVQHECDHLDGTLYPMRMANMTDLSYASEVAGKDGFFAYSPAEFDGPRN